MTKKPAKKQVVYRIIPVIVMHTDFYAPIMQFVGGARSQSRHLEFLVHILDNPKEKWPRAINLSLPAIKREFLQ